MMSKKQVACMLTLHVIYLLLGASIFYHIESPVEMQARAEEKLERLEIQNLLYEYYVPTDPDKLDSILTKLSNYCEKNLFNYTTEDAEAPIKWDFYHSFFFSYTVVSTIGYGNLAPTTHLGRILMIFYGLFGIPINGILFANLGEYFGLQLIKVYRKYKKKSEKRADRLDYFFHNLGMLGQIFLYLVPGFLFFIFLPACMFVVFEGWDYVASVYYAFVTLTTIGFGDIVAGTVNNGFAYGYFVMYQIFLIVWITFGLGYIVMLLGFITSGMRSKGIHKLEQKFAHHVKSTQNRILQGFSKDVAAIRKIINEANLLKLKPVYVDVAPRLCRSTSCPTFTFDVEPRETIYKRKRANSENIQLSSRDMLRIQSDTDLLGIDKEKTFNASAIVRPAELLARVVNVLGSFEEQQRSEEKGVHMFEDNEILASEKPSMWRIGDNAILSDSPNSRARRALSIAVPNHRKDSITKMDNEITWTNGENPDKYIESMNQRRGGKLSLPTGGIETTALNDSGQLRGNLLTRLFRKSSSTESPGVSTPQSTDSPKEIHRPRRGSIFPIFDFNQDNDDAAKEYKEKTKRGRHSIFPTFDFSEREDDDMARAYKERTQQGRRSIFPTFDFNDDDEDKLAAAYNERTKRGRRSIFPTFNFDDLIKEDDDMAKAYKEKTKRGRHSIFPTFNFDEDDDDDDDMARKYKESTRKGRRSIFLTFNFGENKQNDDDSLNEEEIKSYQKRTKKGRGSLFPTFAKSKKNESEDDIIPDDLEEIKRYHNKTKRGRASLFPSFGRERKNSNTEDYPSDLAEDIKKYQKQTKRGRNSLFAGDLDNFRNSDCPAIFGSDNNSIADLSQDEQVEALEHTSVADLLRALALLEAASPQSNYSSHTTGLADLISGGLGDSPLSQGTRRRGSIRPDFAIPSRSEPEETSTGPRRRRISVRGAAPQFTPTLATVVARAELQSTALTSRENRMNMVNSPPPYSETADNNEDTPPPRVRRYSPAPGNTSIRAASGPVPRLFSRLRKESSTSIEEESSRRGSLTDVVIDNNKDQT